VSLASRAGDLFYTFRFIKLLTTPFNETDAFKLGIIDDKGRRTKNPISSSEEKSAFTTFHRLVFNLKKLLAKAPGGSSKLASYASALFLLKEKYELSDKSINKILKAMEVDTLDFMAEDYKWYLLEDGQLSPGVYKVRHEKDGDVSVQTNDKVLVHANCYPIGEMFGLGIYEVKHVNSNTKLYVTLGEVYR
jgi:hypothetical protein